MSLDIVTAPRPDSRHWQQQKVTWHELVSWMGNPAEFKECGNYLLGRLRQSTVDHDDKPGCVGLHRRKAAVVTRSALSLDVDHPSPEFLDRLLLLSPHRAIIHTTFSSTIDAPRYRVLLAVDRDMTPDEYRAVVSVVMRDLGLTSFDLGSAEPERYMFRPSAQHAEWFQHWVIDGDPVPVDAFVARWRANPGCPPPKASAGKRSPFELPGPVGAFNRVYDIDDVITNFGVPYESDGENRWHLAGATSGAGISLVADGLVYSHHASDPAAGQTCSAFDLVRLHRFAEMDDESAVALPVHRRPSHAAMVELAGADPQVVAAMLGLDFAVEGRETPVARAASQHAAELAADPTLLQEVTALQRRARAKVIVTELEANRNPRPQPDGGTLAELLARPEEPRWRIDGLLPAEGRMLLSAQRKTGKTTMTNNMARSLITGEAFLGRFPVEKMDGRVVVLNYEVSAATFALWANDVGVPPDRMFVVNLRGRRNLLADQAGRDELAAIVRQQEGQVLVVDPFGRAFTGGDQNSASEVGPWLVRLDEVAEAAGVTELVLTAHAGWDGERTRGSSALEDWPDVIATVTRDEASGLRFLRAEGRDVDLEEDALNYDPATRHLTLAGTGNRKQVRESSRVDQLTELVREVVLVAPDGAGLTVTDIRTALRNAGHQPRHGDVNNACAAAVDRGWVRRERGPRNSWRHFAAGDQGGV